MKPLSLNDKQDRTVGEAIGSESVKAGEAFNFSSEINLRKFNRWSVDNPYLYSLVTKVYLEDQLVDAISTSV
jgi:beta-galactosidase